MSRQADKQGIRRLGREGHENESMASQHRTGEGAREPELTRAIGRERGRSHVEDTAHSQPQFKLWISQTVGGEGMNSHVLGMNPSVAGPNIREAEAN